MQLQKFNSLHALYDYFQKHLQKYLDEFVFRYNTRKLSEGDRFNLMLSGLANHLPYSKLIEDEKQQPVKWFNAFPNNRQVEGKQGTISFPDADATGDVQQ